MNVLIPTEPRDSHAVVVRLALESLGHEARCLMTADHPTKQKNSMHIEQDCFAWKSRYHEEAIQAHHYDVVWWRRPRKPYVPSNWVHSDDYDFVCRENRMFFEALTDSLAPHGWWVNPKYAALRAQSKALQLQLAYQAGMLIPKTLCSNDPLEIRAFVLEHESDGVIYKPLNGTFWREEDAMKMTYTRTLPFLNLPNNALLQAAPGIYQKEIKKQYELRITCFGDCLVAVKIDSQLHAETQMDWREHQHFPLSIEPYALPHRLEQQIRSFMRALGIVFGCFDFIVTPDDQYVFLEVNEQGQFLWIEERNRDVKLLDRFIQFLLSQTQSFEWMPHQTKLSIEDFALDTNLLVQDYLRHHVDLNAINMIPN